MIHLQRRNAYGTQVFGKIFSITIMRKIKLKTTVRYHLTSVRIPHITKLETSTSKTAGKKEPSYTAIGNTMCSCYYGKLWMVLKAVKMDLPCDPAVKLLGIYPKDTIKLI